MCTDFLVVRPREGTKAWMAYDVDVGVKAGELPLGGLAVELECQVHLEVEQHMDAHSLHAHRVRNLNETEGNQTDQREKEKWSRSPLGPS